MNCDKKKKINGKLGTPNGRTQLGVDNSPSSNSYVFDGAKMVDLEQKNGHGFNSQGFLVQKSEPTRGPAYRFNPPGHYVKNGLLNQNPVVNNIQHIQQEPFDNLGSKHMFVEQVSSDEKKSLGISQGTLYQSPRRSLSVPQETLYQSPQGSLGIPQKTLYQSPQGSPSIPQKTLTKVIPARQVKPSERRMAMGLEMREKMSKGLPLAQKAKSAPAKKDVKVVAKPNEPVLRSRERGMAMGLAMREKVSNDLNLDRKIKPNWGK